MRFHPVDSEVLQMRVSRSRYPAAPIVSASSSGSEAQAPAHDIRSTVTHPPAKLRLRVFMTRAKLDRQLATGSTYEATDALALRVRQLTERGTRMRIARELRGAVDYVDKRESGPVISAVVIDPAAVRAGREAILGLAERLEATAAVSARGIVFARALLTDGSSPLYNAYAERTVNEAVFEVQDALGGYPIAGYDAVAA
jgi:hypothetical protein